MAAAVSVPLPAHALAMDVPRESDLVVNEFGDQGYCWTLTETERAHIATMLEIDGENRIQNCLLKHLAS